jgi:WD40 repeat protein
MSPGLVGATFESGNVVLWDVVSKTVAKLKAHPKARARKLAFSPTNVQIALSGASDGSLSVIALDRKK